MKLASAIESGLTGASTLSLLQEALHKIDPKSPRPLLYKSGILDKLKNGKKKDATKLYIQLAGELLSNAAFYGLTGLGKKKNAVLRGGILGAAAGLGSVFLTHDKEGTEITKLDGTPQLKSGKRQTTLKDKALTVGLYTAGGILAGLAVKKLNGKKLKGKKGNRKKK